MLQIHFFKPNPVNKYSVPVIFKWNTLGRLSFHNDVFWLLLPVKLFSLEVLWMNSGDALYISVLTIQCKTGIAPHKVSFPNYKRVLISDWNILKLTSCLTCLISFLTLLGQTWPALGKLHYSGAEIFVLLSMWSFLRYTVHTMYTWHN